MKSMIYHAKHEGLSPVHTVAEKWDCRWKRRDNGEIRRLSHFSATVRTGYYNTAAHSDSVFVRLLNILTHSLTHSQSVVLCTAFWFLNGRWCL